MKNKNLLSVRVMKIQKLYYFTISLLIVGVFLLPKITIYASEITPQKLIELINQERIQNNLSPLSVNLKLEEAANNKAQDLINNQYFAHTTPNGKKFSEWIKEVDYQYVYAGENLAMDFITSEGTVKAWMNSESHKKNILSQLYDETAIATASGIFQGQPTIIVTQLFGRQKKSITSNELTLINFNGIIKDNKKKIVLPSLLHSNTLDIVYLESGKHTIKLSAVTMESKIPSKDKFLTNNKQITPQVAGIMTNSASSKNITIHKNIYIYFFLILISYIFILAFKILYRKPSHFFYSYK